MRAETIRPKHHQIRTPHPMKTTMLRSIARVAIAITALSSCVAPPGNSSGAFTSKNTLYTGIGAALGGSLGSLASKKGRNQTEGAVLGGVLGGLAGAFFAGYDPNYSGPTSRSTRGSSGSRYTSYSGRTSRSSTNESRSSSGNRSESSSSTASTAPTGPGITSY